MENGNKNYHEIVLNYWLSDLFLKIFWMKSEKKKEFYYQLLSRIVPEKYNQSVGIILHEIVFSSDSKNANTDFMFLLLYFIVGKIYKENAR